MTPLTLRVRPLRERKGWSQAELGRRAGVASTTINRIERGETASVTFGTLEKIARALGVSPRSLIVASRG